jgi:MEMO1 family protein
MERFEGSLPRDNGKSRDALVRNPRDNRKSRDALVRNPAVAGQFYPGTSRELSAQIRGFLDPQAHTSDAIACVLPHAGYIYSGAVAGATVSRIRARDVIFLLGPNHTGFGTPFSVMSSGAWKTPLGNVAVNEALCRELIAGSPIFNDDSTAHRGEHSLEVELPFLQTVMGEFSIIPVAIASNDGAALQEAGTQIGLLIKRQGLSGRPLIVASSDMTHYESQEEARVKDMLAIAAIVELDADKLLRVVRQKDISMCGYAPVAVMLAASKVLGAKKAELVKYQTSGDVTGDYSSVVGYAGIIIH